MAKILPHERKKAEERNAVKIAFELVDLLRTRPLDEYAQLLAEVLECLAKATQTKTQEHFKFLLTAYGMSPLLLSGNPEAPNDRLHHHLVGIAGQKEGERVVSSLIVTDEKTQRYIMSGADMFPRVTDRPEYYIKTADLDIFEQNIECYKCIHGANYFEVCGGDGTKTAKFLRRLRDEYGIISKKIFYNDAYQPLSEEAKEILSEFAEVELVPGDITRDSFWQNPIFQRLKKDSAPTVFAMHGATFNNFEYPQELLMKAKKAFKAGTTFLISVDCTTDPDTLARSYNCPEMEQWGVLARVYFLWKLGFALNPEDFTAGLVPTPIFETGKVILKFAFTNWSACECELEIKKGDVLEKAVLTLPAQSVAYDEIIKYHEGTVMKMFAQAGLTVTGVLKRAVEDKTNVVIFAARSLPIPPKRAPVPSA